MAMAAFVKQERERRKITYANGWKNQESRQTDHLVEMPLAARIVPAKPGIPRRQDPRRRSKQEPAEPAMRRSYQVAQLTADVKTGAARMLRRHQLVEDQPKLRSLDPDKLKALRPHRRSPEGPQARQPPPPCEPRHPGRRHGGAKEERSCPPAQDGEGQQRQLVTCGRPRKSTKPKASHTLRPISARETSGCARIRDNFAMPCGEESALGIETGSSMRPTIARTISVCRRRGRRGGARNHG